MKVSETAEIKTEAELMAARGRTRESVEPKKPYRRAYVMSQGYDFSSLYDSCNDLVYLVKREETLRSFEEIYDLIRLRLSGFDFRKDIIVGVNNVSWVLALGFYLRSLGIHEFTLAFHRSKEVFGGKIKYYEFYRVTERGLEHVGSTNDLAHKVQ